MAPIFCAKFDHTCAFFSIACSSTELADCLIIRRVPAGKRLVVEW